MDIDKRTIVNIPHDLGQILGQVDFPPYVMSLVGVCIVHTYTHTHTHTLEYN